MTNVAHFPSQAKLDVLARQIELDLVRCAQTAAGWVEATIDLCLHLAEARAEFPDDIGFGRWFDGSGFKLNKNDRAAAIAMGQNMDQARPVLEITERRSLELIRKDCRFPTDRKPTNDDESKEPAKKKRGRPLGSKNKPIGPKLQEAMAILTRRQAEGQEVSAIALQEHHNVSRGTAERAFTTYRAALEAANAPPPDFGLSATMQQKLEAAIAAHKRKLDREFDVRVQEASRKWVNEIRIPDYLEKVTKIEKMLNWPRNAVMTAIEYKKILMCLHPDGLLSRTKEQLEEAFRIFTHYKPKMAANEEDTRRLMSDMPRTLEEMLARRRPKI